MSAPTERLLSKTTTPMFSYDKSHHFWKTLIIPYINILENFNNKLN
jgi:hypothetical protein